MKRVEGIIEGCDCIYDGLTCLSLAVFTDIFPPTVPADHEERCGISCRFCGHAHDRSPCSREGCVCPARALHDRRHGADITLHTRFPTTKEALAGETIDEDAEQPLLWGFRCRYDHYTSGLDANELWRAIGDASQFHQPESFWRAFETEFVKRDRKAREERTDDKYDRCPSCDGVGVVAKERA